MAGYKIKSGDTLSQIAKKNGMSVKALLANNPSIKNANQIKIGQSIKIPSEKRMKLMGESKTDNPYKGLGKTEMGMMARDTKENRERLNAGKPKPKTDTPGRAMTRAQNFKAKNSPKTSATPSKTAKTIKDAPHLGLAQKSMARAKKARGYSSGGKVDYKGCGANIITGR